MTCSSFANIAGLRGFCWEKKKRFPTWAASLCWSLDIGCKPQVGLKLEKRLRFSTGRRGVKYKIPAESSFQSLPYIPWRKWFLLIKKSHNKEFSLGGSSAAQPAAQVSSGIIWRASWWSNLGSWILWIARAWCGVEGCAGWLQKHWVEDEQEATTTPVCIKRVWAKGSESVGFFNFDW